MDSLFWSIPLKETIDFILDELYVRKLLGIYAKAIHFQ